MKTNGLYEIIGDGFLYKEFVVSDNDGPCVDSACAFGKKSPEVYYLVDIIAQNGFQKWTVIFVIYLK